MLRSVQNPSVLMWEWSFHLTSKMNPGKKVKAQVVLQSRARIYTKPSGGLLPHPGPSAPPTLPAVLHILWNRLQREIRIVEKKNPSELLHHHSVLCDFVRNENLHSMEKIGKKKRSERKNYSQGPNKNSQETIITSINILCKFTNSMILCFRRIFQN